MASPMRRAQETAEGINELLELPITTDEELFEVRQSDAFYANLPHAAEHATLAWMPHVAPEETKPGAESFAGIAGRARHVRERLEEHGAARILAVSHYGFLHFFLGLTLFGDDFGPQHLRTMYTIGHANTGISIFTLHEQRIFDGIPIPRLGTDHVERPRASVGRFVTTAPDRDGDLRSDRAPAASGASEPV